MERSLVASRSKPNLAVVRRSDDIVRVDPNRDLSMAEQVRLQQRRSWRRFIAIILASGAGVVILLGGWIHLRVPSLKELSSAVSGSIDSSPAISRIEQKVDTIQAAQQQPIVQRVSHEIGPDSRTWLRSEITAAIAENDRNNVELRKKNQELEATLKKEWEAKKKALSENKQLKTSLVQATQQIKHEQAVGRAAQKDAFKVIDKRGEIIAAIFFAITRVESGGNYRANCDIYAEKRESIALGRYQVMSFNVGPWSRTHYERELTPLEFCANGDAQDMIARGRLGEYWDQTQDIRKVAALWHGGNPNYNSLASDGNMTTKQYVHNVVTIVGVIRPDLTRFPKEKKTQVATATGRRGGRK